MKHYFNHIKLQEPHVRRRHALRAATVITGLFFVAWLATLPMRLDTGVIAEEHNDQAAATAQAMYATQPQLEVASTTYSTY